MGTLGGNGGGWPPEGGGPPDDLPELPPEWGVVVIPDDPAELAEEASRVRKELRRTARSRIWRRRLHLPPPRLRRRRGDDAPTLGVPLLIVSIAVLATLASLFAVAWPGQPRQATGPTAAATPNGAPPTATVALLTVIRTLIGFIVLMRYVLKRNPPAGLPLLNARALLGFLLSSLLVSGTVHIV